MGARFSPQYTSVDDASNVQRLAEPVVERLDGVLAVDAEQDPADSVDALEGVCRAVQSMNHRGTARRSRNQFSVSSSRAGIG